MAHLLYIYMLKYLTGALNWWNHCGFGEYAAFKISISIPPIFSTATSTTSLQSSSLPKSATT